MQFNFVDWGLITADLAHLFKVFHYLKHFDDEEHAKSARQIHLLVCPPENDPI